MFKHLPAKVFYYEVRLKLNVGESWERDKIHEWILVSVQYISVQVESKAAFSALGGAVETGVVLECGCWLTSQPPPHIN